VKLVTGASGVGMLDNRRPQWCAGVGYQCLAALSLSRIPHGALLAVTLTYCAPQHGCRQGGHESPAALAILVFRQVGWRCAIANANGVAAAAP
jgi:hypothetical protein